MPYKDPEVKKAKHREYAKKWYNNNKKQHQAGVLKVKKKARERWIEFKASQKCSHCGASHPAIIDFHHVIRDKTKRSVNRLAADNKYRAAHEEIKKCIPLCSNCHRVLHWDEAQAKKLKRSQKKAKP